MDDEGLEYGPVGGDSVGESSANEPLNGFCELGRLELSDERARTVLAADDDGVSSDNEGDDDDDDEDPALTSTCCPVSRLFLLSSA